MKKIKPIPHIKDAKKVKAGKARAAKSLRISGRFTSNKFFAEIEQQAKQAGVKDTFAFFRQNENEYTSLYDSWIQASEYFDYAFMNVVKDYTGIIYCNDRKNLPATALYKILNFNQYLKNNHDVVSWNIMPFIKLAGAIKFSIPADREMEDMDLEGLEDFLIDEPYFIKIIVSEKKKGKDTKTYIRKSKGKYKRIEK